MNLVTGVFVEGAQRIAREEKNQAPIHAPESRCGSVDLWGFGKIFTGNQRFSIDVPMKIMGMSFSKFPENQSRESSDEHWPKLSGECLGSFPGFFEMTSHVCVAISDSLCRLGSLKTPSCRRMAYPVPDVMDVQSIASRTSCLTNAVESLLGHAAAMGVASDVELTNKTLQRGYRMVTHDSTGFESGDKPYRWMSLRYVTFEEVASLKSVEELGVSGNIFSQLQGVQGAAGLWHFVIRNFRKSEEKSPVIVTAFFGSRLEIVSAAVQEKFDLLDHDDDPRIIKTALSDADFTQLLYDYFMTGDVHNQKFFKTLATLSILGGETLLHFCCERGLHNCVDYLLRHHSVLTAENPWMRLADPLWQERKWGNSAFSIAAYRGDVQMLKILVAWAKEHDQLQKVLQLKDKKKQDLFQVLQSRIAKGEGAKGNPKLAHNLLAEAAGRRPLYGSQVSSLGPDVSSDEGATVLVDPPKLGKSDASEALGERRTYRLDGKMTLASLSAFFQTILRERDLQGKSVLIVNLKLLPQEDGKDTESAQHLPLCLEAVAG